jgi:hypothetical protein
MNYIVLLVSVADSWEFFIQIVLYWVFVFVFIFIRLCYMVTIGHVILYNISTSILMLHTNITIYFTPSFVL